MSSDIGVFRSWKMRVETRQFDRKTNRPKLSPRRDGFRMTRTAAAAARTSDVSGLPHLTHLAPYEGSHYRDCRRGNGKGGEEGRKELLLLRKL